MTLQPPRMTLKFSELKLLMMASKMQELAKNPSVVEIKKLTKANLDLLGKEFGLKLNDTDKKWTLVNEILRHCIDQELVPSDTILCQPSSGESVASRNIELELTLAKLRLAEQEARVAEQNAKVEEQRLKNEAARIVPPPTGDSNSRHSDKTHNDNKPEECSVCFNNYDDNQLRPRTLPCGHTFCSQCINNANKNGQLTCPRCHAQHAATAATQFPINYGMEALIRKLKGIEVVPEKTLTAKPIKAPARGISKKLHSMVEEQKNSISSLIISCEEVLSQLGEYRGQLGDWKTHHLQLQDRLYALVEQNKSAMKLLELEDTSVVDMTTQGEEGKTQLQAMLGSLDTVNLAQEVFMIINEVDQCNMEVENWLKKCQELFPDVKTVHTSVKVQETIREALEMMTTETGATADPVHLGDSASTINVCVGNDRCRRPSGRPWR
ncbi:uncharacterized protein [Procambarus clarkii]|uniref:uncharacterized protein n=1 Tax=Procambarus clarkii TaxID=6728 RepID=UPI00374262F9